eukprot:GHVS01017163.1.p1 GENE.GHVS01017163.1~~GHVS01017163.1.p1  ORF type:complete len:1265 (+),score=147.65 GHVS01017163.1:207-3797(+)
MAAMLKPTADVYYPVATAPTAAGKIMGLSDDDLGVYKGITFTFKKHLGFDSVITMKLTNKVTVTVKVDKKDEDEHKYAAGLAPEAELKVGSFLAAASIMRELRDPTSTVVPVGPMFNIGEVDVAQQGLVDLVMAVKAVAAAPGLESNIGIQQGGVFTTINPTIEGAATGLLISGNTASYPYSKTEVTVSTGDITTTMVSLRAADTSATGDSVKMQEQMKLLRSVLLSDAHLYSLYPSVMVGGVSKTTTITPATNPSRAEQNEVLSAYYAQLDDVVAKAGAISFPIKGDIASITLKNKSFGIVLDTYQEIGHATYKAANDLVLKHRISNAAATTPAVVNLIDNLVSPKPTSYTYGTAESQAAVFCLPVHIEVQNWIQMVVGIDGNDLAYSASWRYVESFFGRVDYTANASSRFTVTKVPTGHAISIGETGDDITAEIASYSSVLHWSLTKAFVYGHSNPANADFAYELVQSKNGVSVSLVTSTRPMEEVHNSCTYLSPLNPSPSFQGSIEIQSTGLLVKVDRPSTTSKDSTAEDWISLSRSVNGVINGLLGAATPMNNLINLGLYGKTVSWLDVLAKMAIQCQLYSSVYNASEFVFNPDNVGTSNKAALAGDGVKVSVMGKGGLPPVVGDTVLDLSTTFTPIKKADVGATVADASTFGSYFYQVAPATLKKSVLGQRGRVSSEAGFRESLKTFAGATDLIPLPPTLAFIHAYNTVKETDNIVDVIGRGQVNVTYDVNTVTISYLTLGYDPALPLALAMERAEEAETTKFPLERSYAFMRLAWSVGAQVIMSDALNKDGKVKLTLLPELFGKTDYIAESTGAATKGSAEVTSTVLFTDDKTGDEKGLTSGLVTWTELGSGGTVKTEEANNKDFKAILSVATPAAGNKVDVVGLEGRVEFVPGDIIDVAFKTTKTFTTGNIPMFTRLLDQEMDERDVARPAGSFSVEISPGKINFEQKAAFRNFDPQFLYVPGTTRATMNLQSHEREDGSGSTTDQFGHPYYTNAKQLTFSSAVQSYLKSEPDKNYIAMMNENGQADSSYGREELHQLDSVVYTGNVVRFERVKDNKKFSRLSIDAYDVQTMADDRVEKDAVKLFSAAEAFGYPPPVGMTLHRWEATRRALMSAFKDISKPEDHYYEYAVFYNIASEHKFTFGLKVCKGSGCGFLLSADGGGKSTAETFGGSRSSIVTLLFIFCVSIIV